MGKLYKDSVKVMKRNNYRLTNTGPEVTIVKDSQQIINS